jgi:hypothetical protein
LRIAGKELLDARMIELWTMHKNAGGTLEQPFSGGLPNLSDS